MPPITKDEFVLLATLAWLKDPNRSLATQLSEDTGHSLRACQYWLAVKDPRRQPPADIIAKAYDLAMQRFPTYTAIMQKLSKD